MAQRAAAPADATETGAAVDEVTPINVIDAPTLPLDLTQTDIILDMTALCSLPFQPCEEGVRAFRAILLPKGKALHVPHQPGHYIVNGEWSTQRSLALVHFKTATGRKPELLLSFMDFSVMSNESTGMFVESLHLPLQKKRNVYEETPRVTKISDVAGFTPINHHQLPWSAHLKPALTKSPLFNFWGVHSVDEVDKLIREPLSVRGDKLRNYTQKLIEAEVEGILRQDERAGEKQRAKFTAFLEKTMEKFDSLPPGAYDSPLEDRIQKLTDMEPQEWCRTPIKEKLQAGKVEMLARTRFITADVQAQPVERGDVQPDVEDVPAEGLLVLRHGETPTEAILDPHKSPRKGKRDRQPPDAFHPAGATTNNKKRPKSNTSVDSKGEEAPLINPRTGLPYKRNGPYKQRDPTTKALVKLRQMSAANKASDSPTPQPEPSEKINEKVKNELKEAKMRIAELESKLSVAQEMLKKEIEGKELAVSNAKLEVAKNHSMELLVKYQQGIQDGASISSGRAPSLSSFSRASPTTWSTPSPLFANEP